MLHSKLVITNYENFSYFFWHSHCVFSLIIGGKMISGIFKGSSAMLYLDEKMDVIANNLANIQTNGFKRSDVAFNQRFMEEQAKVRDKRSTEPLPQGEIKTYVDTRQGAIQQTGNPLNFALDGQGYLLF